MIKKISIVTLTLISGPMVAGGGPSAWGRSIQHAAESAGGAITSAANSVGDAAVTVNDKAITPAGQAVAHAAQVVYSTTVTNGVLKLEKLVVGGVETSIEIVKGVMATVDGIKGLVGNIQASIDSTMKVVTAAENEIKAMIANPEPWAIVDRSYNVAADLLDVPSAFKEARVGVADIIWRLGKDVVRHFDSGTGSKMENIGIQIDSVGEQTINMCNSIKANVIPVMKSSTNKIHAEVNKMIQAVQQMKL